MIFDAIRESHDLQRDLCRKLTASRQIWLRVRCSSCS